MVGEAQNLSTSTGFEEYCEERWELKGTQVYALIGAAAFAESPR